MCNVSMVNIHLQKLQWVYCPGHARMEGNDWADRLVGKATFTSGLLLGRSEMLRRLRQFLWAQSQGHHIIDHLEERGVEKGSARRSSLKGWERRPLSVRWTVELFQRHHFERGGGVHMGFSEHIAIPSWTELKFMHWDISWLCSLWLQTVVLVGGPCNMLQKGLGA